MNFLKKNKAKNNIINKLKTIILFIALFFSFVLVAQKVVVLHSPTNGVQYFSDDNPLQSAYAAAEISGDTIYLPGGSMAQPTRYEKSLVIYGAGHHPIATTATFKTILSGTTLLSDEADGFHLEGVEISGNLFFDANESVNNVTIKRCNFNFLSVNGDRTNPAENNTFTENVIYEMHSYSIDNLTNSMFFNNIIEGRVGNARNIIFLNNTFLFSGNGINTVNYANNCVFKNNIFLQEYTYLCSGLGASTWSHNIFCNTSLTTPTLGLDPILINNYNMLRADVLINQTGAYFDYTHNYNLTPAALLNLGDDGLETGIYGGFYSWKDQSIPVNPHISSKTISSTSDTNGMIQVNINVHAQDK